MAFRRNCLAASNITLPAQIEVDRESLLVDGSIQVDPPAANLYICLIHPPGPADRPREPLPPLLKFRGVVLYPAQDRRVSQDDAPFGHHGHQIAIAELETQVPAHAQHHDLLIEMATLEQFLQRSKLLHRSIIAVFAPEPFKVPPGSSCC